MADVYTKAIIDTITIAHNLAATIANAEAEKLGDTEWLVAGRHAGCHARGSISGDTFTHARRCGD